MSLLSLTDALIRMDRAATQKDTGRHANYQRTVDLADQYSALATGERFEQFLVIFNRREDPAQFRQRTAITVPKTSSVLAPAITQFHRTSRLPNIRRAVTYDQKSDDTRLEIVRQTMSEFYGQEGVDEYIATVYDWVSLIDPNCYTVVEFERSDKDKILPYPALYWSTMIYEPGRSHRKQLQYLLVQPDPDSTSEYILYAGAFALRYTELPDIDKGRADVVSKATNVYAESPIFQPVDANGKASGPAYLRQYYETKCPFVQAECMGYLPDPVTSFETFVSALEPAKNVLIDYLRTDSNYTLSKYMHVMPQKVVAQRPCNALDCNQGTLPDGSECSVCKGTGIAPANSQPTDTIEVPMPRNGLDMPDLAKYIHYVQVELATFEALGKDLADLKNACYVAIFNNEVVMQQQVTAVVTATQIASQLDNTNNTLMPFAEHKAQFWRFLVKCIAVLVSDTTFAVDRFGAVYEFPKNLKPITKEEVYIILKSAIDSGAPQLHIEQIVKDLLEMDYDGDPDGLARLRVRLSHIPFIGLDWDKIVYLDGRGYIRKRDMILITYQDSVFADLERLHEGFYDKKYSERDKLIMDYINTILSELPQDSLQIAMGKVNPALDAPQPPAA